MRDGETERSVVGYWEPTSKYTLVQQSQDCLRTWPVLEGERDGTGGAATLETFTERRASARLPSREEVLIAEFCIFLSVLYLLRTKFDCKWAL